jgi:hypothetical protein
MTLPKVTAKNDPPEPIRISYDGAADDNDQIHQKAITKLLSALLVEDSAFNLRSKASM